MATPLVQNLIEFIPKVRGAGFQQLSRQMRTTHQNLFSLKNLFTSFIGYDIYSGLRNLIPSLIETSQQLGAMKSRFNAVSESASAGADELNWIGEQSKRLGLDFLRTADDYSIFFATVSKNMGQPGTRKVFEQWAETFRVLHIDPERQSRVLYALREMSSKGKIYMQDLALQLGSAVPDAMNIAARSMGYTGPKAVERFREAIKGGEVDVKRFIPLFSEAVNKQYVSQKALSYAMNQTDAQLQTIKTHWTFIQKNILESGMQDDIIKFLKLTNKLLGFLEAHSKGIYKTIKLIVAALGIIFALKAFSGAYKIYGIVAKILPKLTTLARFLVILRGLFAQIVGSPFAKFLFSILSKGGGVGWTALIVLGIGAISVLILRKMFPNIERSFFLMITRMHQAILEMIWATNKAWNDSPLGKLWHWKTYEETMNPKDFSYMNDFRYKYKKFQEESQLMTPMERLQSGPFAKLLMVAPPDKGTRAWKNEVIISKIDASVRIDGANITSPEDFSKVAKESSKNTYEQVLDAISRAVPNSLNFGYRPQGYLNY